MTPISGKEGLKSPPISVFYIPQCTSFLWKTSLDMLLFFAWWGYCIDCFLFSLLQHRVLTGFVTYSMPIVHLVNSKQLQEPCDVKGTRIGLNLVIWRTNWIWLKCHMETQVQIIDLDSLRQGIFRSTSGAIVTNRIQDGGKESIQQILILFCFFFHDYLTLVAAGNLSTWSLKEPVVTEVRIQHFWHAITK